MKITPDHVATVRYTLKDSQGKLLEKAAAPLVYLHGHGNTLPKIEEALDGQEVGFRTTLALCAADAFGARDESLALTVVKSSVPPGVKVGDMMNGRREDGSEHRFRVVKYKGLYALLDGNHHLAGIDVCFTLELVGVRAATPEEIAHGHVHGEHGHAH